MIALPLLLSAALLAGFGTSSGVGETSPYTLVAGDLGKGPFKLDGTFELVKKFDVPGKAFLTHHTLSWGTELLQIRVGQSYRKTSLWSKRVTWVGASLTSGPVTLLAEAAPGSPLREAKLEARVRGCSGRICLEARGWIMDHDQGPEGYPGGVTFLAGIRGGKR